VLILLSGLSTAGALDKNTKGELTNWTWTFKCIDEWLVPGVQQGLSEHQGEDSSNGLR